MCECVCLCGYVCVYVYMWGSTLLLFRIYGVPHIPCEKMRLCVPDNGVRRWNCPTRNSSPLSGFSAMPKPHQPQPLMLNSLTPPPHPPPGLPAPLLQNPMKLSITPPPGLTQDCPSNLYHMLFFISPLTGSPHSSSFPRSCSPSSGHEGMRQPGIFTTTLRRLGFKHFKTYFWTKKKKRWRCFQRHHKTVVCLLVSILK